MSARNAGAQTGGQAVEAQNAGSQTGGQAVEAQNAGPQTGGQAVGTQDIGSRAGGQCVNGQAVKDKPVPGTDVQTETRTVTVMVNGAPVTMNGKKSYIYVDVFDYIDFDLSTPHGSCVVTKRNGENAGYVDVLADGDDLEIYWEK